MSVTFTPIGHVHTTASNLPRHWSLSDVEGTLEIDPQFSDGLQDIQPGQRIVVLFYFHKSSQFRKELLVQNPPHKDRLFGVFSICSPRRPNPIGLSIVQVLSVDQNRIEVKGIEECPSWNNE